MNKERLKEIQENIKLKTFAEERIGLTPSEEEVLELLQYIDELEQVKKQAIEYIENESYYSYKDNEEMLNRVSIEGLLKILKGDE